MEKDGRSAPTDHPALPDLAPLRDGEQSGLQWAWRAFRPRLLFTAFTPAIHSRILPIIPFLLVCMGDLGCHLHYSVYRKKQELWEASLNSAR